MHRRPLVPLLVAIAALAIGCTLNVQSLADREVRSETTEPISLLRAELDDRFPVKGDIVVRGADRAGAEARISLAGLVGASDDPEDIVRGLAVDWRNGDDSEVELFVGYSGPASESVWASALSIELPLGTSLDATAGSATFDVAGLDAQSVMLGTTSGFIRVRDANEVVLGAHSGSIDVVAAAGTLETHSGSIVFSMTGSVIATARSGSIHGQFGGHGEMEADSGSIDVELLTALDGDVRLRADSGSIVLVIPRGAAMSLELSADSGSVDVEVGDVSQHGEDFTGVVNGGGAFTVRASADSGSIAVRERGDG